MFLDQENSSYKRGTIVPPSAIKNNNTEWRSHELAGVSETPTEILEAEFKGAGAVGGMATSAIHTFFNSQIGK